MRCPCGGLSYQSCCQPLHQGISAVSAKTLMCSRFSAFFLKNIDYIVATTVPSQQKLLDKTVLQLWANEMNWTHLDVISHVAKIGKRHAQVHFKAYYDNRQGVSCHDEISSFVKIDGAWYFLDHTVSLISTNKQPCLCGSGDKFKMCCGRFL